MYICLDSDVSTNPKVAHAEYLLQQQLRETFGVRARLITLYPGKNGEKVGIDDLIVSSGESFEYKWKELRRDALIGYRFRLPEFVTGNKLVTADWPRAEAILTDRKYASLLIQGGTTFLHASTGVGKTWMLLQLAISLVTGKEFLGFHPNRPRPKKVALLQSELTNAAFAERVKMAEKAFGRESINDLVVCSSEFQLSTVDSYRNLTIDVKPLKQMINMHGFEVLMIDPLQSYFNLAEGSVDHGREFMKAICSVAKETSCSIIMSHHQRKDTTGQSLDQMRGASSFSDLCDTVLGLRKLPYLEQNEKGKMVEQRNEFNQIIYHKTDLVISFDKLRHNMGPLPDDLKVTRMPDLDVRINAQGDSEGDPNPFFRPRGEDFSGYEDHQTYGGFIR